MIPRMHDTAVGILHALGLSPELCQLGGSHALTPLGVHFWRVQPSQCLHSIISHLQCLQSTISILR